MNGYIKTFVLMAGMTALVTGVGALLGGASGMSIALVIAAMMNLWAWYGSDKAVLKHYNAKQVSAGDAPQLYAMVERLSRNASLPMPKLFIIESDQPNAFATGRNPENASVAVNTGLLSRLKPDEIEGVVAHELAHIKHRDTLIMTVTATFAGAISMISQFGMFFGHGLGGGDRERPNPLAGLLVMLLAPLAAMVVQMAISRAREFEADKLGAQISGKPRALATALASISNDAKLIDNLDTERNPASAHMFIINPLHLRSIGGMFSTHPPTEERIRRLLEIEQTGGFAKRDEMDRVFGNSMDQFDSGKQDDFGTGKRNPWL